MTSKKIWVTGLVGAVFACSACVVVPALLLVFGGGASAAVTHWLGPNLLSLVISLSVFLAAGLGYYLWHRGKKTI